MADLKQQVLVSICQISLSRRSFKLDLIYNYMHVSDAYMTQQDIILGILITLFILSAMLLFCSIKISCVMFSKYIFKN